MPREQRKRGKKHKAKTDDVIEDTAQVASSSAIPIYDDQVDGLSSDAPFGHVDPDVKAYFKTVDDQLKEWQNEGVDTEVDVDLDPNEQRRMFFTAALSEMNDKELQLATDPECSVILERMLHSMDDFARRVFTDSLAGSWIQLMKDRFASHVCQTLFALAIDTIHRETQGVVSLAPTDPGKGELLKMTQLVLDICEGILPDITDLMRNQFASHVIRALLILLCPSGVFTSTEGHHSPSTRSKKSAQWKAKKGDMKSVLDPSDSNTSAPVNLIRPKSFMDMAKRFLDHIGQNLGGNEVRALAIDKAASPLLQMFLELESHLQQADQPNSLMDHVLTGLISDLHAGKEASSSAYVATLLMDSTSSHLAESLIRFCPITVFNQIWKLYLTEDIARLASHPVSNFVVSRAISRLSAPDVIEVNERLASVWKKCLKTSRLGPLISLINRAGCLGIVINELLQVVRDIFDLSHTTDLSLLVSCVLRLKPRSEYLRALNQNEKSDKDGHKPETQDDGHSSYHRYDADPLEPKIQGSLLLQAMLTLPEPQNEVVLDSFLALEPSALLAFACHPTSSRVIDAVFETSSAVSLRSKKKVVNTFVDQTYLLIDDRVGSRVADRLWAAADPYLKEKMARSLIPHEQFLAGSRYARFFTRKVNLPLLKRNPQAWKEVMAKESGKRSSANAISIQDSRAAGLQDNRPEKVAEQQPSTKKRKDSEAELGDEIDALFSKVKRPKFSKLEAATAAVESNSKPSTSSLDKSVLEAIKGAPRTEEKRTKSKSKKK